MRKQVMGSRCEDILRYQKPHPHPLLILQRIRYRCHFFFVVIGGCSNLLINFWVLLYNLGFIMGLVRAVDITSRMIDEIP
jgi:hypothetical protein